MRQPIHTYQNKQQQLRSQIDLGPALFLLVFLKFADCWILNLRVTKQARTMFSLHPRFISTRALRNLAIKEGNSKTRLKFIEVLGRIDDG